MKLQNKQLSAAITLALILIITATLIITAVPTTFGQQTTGQTLKTSIALFVMYNPIGLGQTQMIKTTVYPLLYSINHTITVTRPNGTSFTMVNASDLRREEAYFSFVVDQLGTWKVSGYWPGDTTHTPTAGSTYTASSLTFLVQSESVTIPAAKLPSFSFVNTVPYSKAGTGDTIYIVGWVSPPREYISAIFSEFDFVITTPDGTKDTSIQQPESPATSSFSYVCSQAGTYSVVLKFPGSDVYLPSESPAWTWTVEDGYVVPTYPSEPLPTGPWKYPIPNSYQQWFQIAGPWPESQFNASYNNFNPWSTAPNTPHVLWRMVGGSAGITGGSEGMGGGGIVGAGGSAPTVVAAQGRLYYTTSENYVSSSTTLQSHPVLWCVDQFTGEVIFKKDIPGTGSGGTPIIEIQPRVKIDPEAIEYVTGGAFSLWLTGGGLREINPFTGEIMYYNASLSVSMYHDHAFYINNYPQTGNLSKFDCRSKGIIWTNNAGAISFAPGRSGSFPSYAWNGILIALQRGTGGYPNDGVLRSWNATDGAILSPATSLANDLPAYAMSGAGTGGIIVGDGKMFVHCSDLYTYAIDIYTGKIAWKSDTPTEYPWGDFVAYNAASAYGMVIEQSWDGHLWAYDTSNGKLVWKSDYTGNTTETAMGTYAWWGKLAIADGKIYGGTGQHTQPSPNARGDRLYCVNATDGTFIWSLPEWQTGSNGISSGMLFQNNNLDGCLYMFGKGPTAVTVSASPKTVANGANVLIEGTVTDQSPGSKDTPAVSDASQESWVPYLYMNKPMPTNATGVTVFLQAMGSDGTVIDITHVTTDIMGNYKYVWTPPAQDAYTILATFEGSESYWTSSGATGLSVGSALPEPVVAEAAPDNTPIFAGIIAAVVVAIVIGILNLVMLRRRK